MKPETDTKLFGLMAEFDTVEQRCSPRLAAPAWPAIGRWMPTPPTPWRGCAEELGEPKTRIPIVVLIGGLVGAGAAS